MEKLIATQRNSHDAIHTLAQARAELRLWLCGAGMLLALAGFAWRYPLAPNRSALTDIGKLAGYAWPEFVGYVGGMMALFLLYLLALRASQHLPTERTLPIVLAAGALMGLGMYSLYPVNAIDMFLYAARSRLWSSYGVNPSAVPFNRFPGDAWNAYITGDWAARVSPYGPLWNLIAAPITALAGDRILVALVGFKLLMAACVLAGGWAIARARAASGLGAAAAGALFYIWNPLVLWEGIGNGHNDVVLMLPLLLAFYAWAARRDKLVIPLLIVAAMIKYVTLPLLPLAAIAIWRRPENRAARGAIAAWSAGLSALALVAALFPFYDLRAIVSSVREQDTIFYTSPAAAAIALLGGRYGHDLVANWATGIGRALLLLALLWQAARVWRAPDQLPRACFELMFVLLLVAMPSARSWYLIWLAGLAALLPWGWPAWRTVAWCAGGLAGYAFLIWVEAWWQPGYNLAQIVAVPVIMGPTALITVAEVVRSRLSVVGRQ